MTFKKDKQYYKFCAYGFLKNLRIFDPFLLLFLVSKQLSYAEIGVLYAIREIVINLFEVISGVIADVLGRKRAMVMAYVFYLLSFAVFYFASRFSSLLVAFLLFGIADAFRTGTHKAMILHYLQKHEWGSYKTEYYGCTRSWSQKGSAVTSLTGASVVLVTGEYELMFLLSMIPYLIGLTLLVSYPDYLNANNSVSIRQIWPVFKEHFIDLLKTLKRISSLGVILTTSGYTGYYKATKDYLQILIAGFAVSFPFVFFKDETQNAAIYVGVIYFVLYLISSVASRKAFLTERLWKTAGNALSELQLLGLLLGCLAGVCYYLNWFWLAVAMFSMIFIIQNLRRPVAVKYIGEAFESRLMASVMSVESQAETVFAALVALILGVIVEVFGLGPGITLVSGSLLFVQLAVKKVRK